jgi:hypothetical protein
LYVEVFQFVLGEQAHEIAVEVKKIVNGINEKNLIENIAFILLIP